MASPQRVRICLLIPHLAGGGAEHVIETLARHLNPEKYDIHLVLTGSSESPMEPFNHRVTIHQLRASRVRKSAFGLVKLLWRLHPHALLSGIAHLNLLVLSLRPVLPRNTRIIVRQNGALAATFASHTHPRLAARAYAHTYRRAERIICQSDSMAREIACELEIEAQNLIVLPNPTDVQRLRETAASSSQRINEAVPLLLAFGRFVPEKGFDLLVDAFAALSAEFGATELVIAGEGPSKAALIQQANALGLRDRIHFPGHLAQPLHQFGHASMFVLSSRTEGLPNALLEAAAIGLPIVATPASPGIVDLLQNKEGAWLAADISSSALCNALQTAMKAIQCRRRFNHPWIERFRLSNAIPAYEAVIDRLIAEDTP